MSTKPLVLMILDGWGERPAGPSNAITEASTPHWDWLTKHALCASLEGSGHAVGLPAGQMGNSEVGHMTIGLGRVVEQDLTKIHEVIASDKLGANTQLQKLIGEIKHPHPAFGHPLPQAGEGSMTDRGTITSGQPQGEGSIHDNPHVGRRLHLIGLLSPGGVHSHEAHWFAILAELAKQGITEVYCHPILDGRDTPPQSAENSLRALEQALKPFKQGRIASIVGRYYAMDRDKRWERIEAAYRLFVDGAAVRVASSAEEGLKLAYAAGETDEFVKPTLISPQCRSITESESHATPSVYSASEPSLDNTNSNENRVTIHADDIILCLNFRADRMRELTETFIAPEFSHFARSWCMSGDNYFTLTSYADYLPTQILFPPTSLAHSLADCLAEHNLKQLRLAETEKYAHVTFFFNGGAETPVDGEDRQLIASPKVATYDLQPEMSAPAVTDALVSAIESQRYDLIVVNYANADMVGHSGNLAAAKLAVEAIDTCLGKVIKALEQWGGELLLTADHGNAECMQDPITGQPHTAHTSDPVPLRYLGRPATLLPGTHTLADIAPTVLTLLGLPIPSEMSGHPLIHLGATTHA